MSYLSASRRRECFAALLEFMTCPAFRTAQGKSMLNLEGSFSTPRSERLFLSEEDVDVLLGIIDAALNRGPPSNLPASVRPPNMVVPLVREEANGSTKELVIAPAVVVQVPQQSRPPMASPFIVRNEAARMRVQNDLRDSAAEANGASSQVNKARKLEDGRAFPPSMSSAASVASAGVASAKGHGRFGGEGQHNPHAPSAGMGKGGTSNATFDDEVTNAATVMPTPSPSVGTSHHQPAPTPTMKKQVSFTLPPQPHKSRSPMSSPHLHLSSSTVNAKPAVRPLSSTPPQIPRTAPPTPPEPSALASAQTKPRSFMTQPPSPPTHEPYYDPSHNVIYGQRKEEPLSSRPNDAHSPVEEKENEGSNPSRDTLLSNFTNPSFVRGVSQIPPNLTSLEKQMNKFEQNLCNTLLTKYRTNVNQREKIIESLLSINPQDTRHKSRTGQIHLANRCRKLAVSTAEDLKSLCDTVLERLRKTRPHVAEKPSQHLPALKEVLRSCRSRKKQAKIQNVTK